MVEPAAVISAGLNLSFPRRIFLTAESAANKLNGPSMMRPGLHFGSVKARTGNQLAQPVTMSVRIEFN